MPEICYSNRFGNSDKNRIFRHLKIRFDLRLRYVDLGWFGVDIVVNNFLLSSSRRVDLIFQLQPSSYISILNGKTRKHSTMNLSCLSVEPNFLMTLRIVKEAQVQEVFTFDSYSDKKIDFLVFIIFWASVLR